MDNIYIILVEPIYSGNVGAIARIMNNFNLKHLRIIGSIPEKNDFYLAVHSEFILENAEVFNDLETAISDLDRVIAFSRRKGKLKPIDFSPPQMAAYIAEIPSLKVGIVFGRETYGLTDEEADLCPLRCHIQANLDFPSLNLAQAVAIAAWELFKTTTAPQSTIKHQEAAFSSEIQSTQQYLIEVMKSIGYFRDHETTNWEVFLERSLNRLNPSKDTLYRWRQMFNRFHVLVTGKGKGYKIKNKGADGGTEDI